MIQIDAACGDARPAEELQKLPPPAADVEYRSPVAEADKLQPVTVTAAVGPVLADLVDSFNLNVDKLNGRMFTFLDYAVVGKK